MGLDQVFYGNSVQEWLVASGVLVVAAIGLWLVERYVLRSFVKFARTTQTDLDDLVAHVLRKTKFFLILIVAAFVASLSLVLEPRVAMVLQRAAAIAIVIQGGIWASAAISFWVERFVERTAGEDAAAVTTVSAMSFVGRLAVWSIVLLLILDNLGVEVTALLTGLGIGGIAVALAAQNILGDLFASLSIILDKPFVIGDFLIVGDFKGNVEYVGLKTTRLRAIGGEQLVIGNSDLVSTRLRNLGRMDDRRGQFTVGVTYETPRERLAEIPAWIREIAESHEHVRFDRSHLSNYGAYAIEFDTVFYMTETDYGVFMDTKQSILLQLHERFEQHGIDYAYPTQVVYTAPVPAGAAAD